MTSTRTRRHETSPVNTQDHQARQRLFAFLARPDGSIQEIRNTTMILLGDLADWMAGIHKNPADITRKVIAAMDAIDAIDAKIDAQVGAAYGRNRLEYAVPMAILADDVGLGAAL